MEIGIHEFDLRHLREYEALGVTCCKWGADVEVGPQPQDRQKAAAARAAGLRPIIDLRTGAEWIRAECARQEQAHLEKRPDLVIARFAELARQQVELLGDYCRDWEVWGECACPWVSQGVFLDSVCYDDLLRAAARTIRETQPGARIWTGGNGMNLDVAWAQSLLAGVCKDSFDVLNLHPYFISLRQWDTTGTVLERSLRYMRRRLDQDGRGQPFAATEWGYPVTRDGRLLESNVAAGCQALTWEEASVWYERDLAAFAEWGFEVVVVHSLYDTGGGEHWGRWCGLMERDGTRKPTWWVVRRWAQAGA